MFKHTILLAAAAGMVLALAPVAEMRAATITEGELMAWVDAQTGPFRLIFVTSTWTPVTSRDDIGYYNAFVNSDANGADSIVASLGVDWFCIGSTTTVSAKANTKTYLTTDASYDPYYDVPIYRLDGSLVASGNDTLWDGGIDAAISFTSTGQEWNQIVATGTDTNGTLYIRPSDQSAFPLGGGGWHDAYCSNGNPTATDGRWIINAVGGDVRQITLPLYSMSTTVVPEPAPVVPEPSTFLLWAFGSIGILVMRRRGFRR